MQTPAAFDVDELVRRNMDNEIGLWSAGARLVPATSAGRDGSIGWFTNDLPIPFFNQAFVLRSPADGAALERTVDRLRAHGRPFSVRLRSGLDDALLPRLAALDLHEDLDESYPAMALSPIPEDVADALPVDLEIRQATDPAAFDDHVAVVCAGFGMPLELARRFLAPDLLSIPGVSFLVGYAAREPVATALAYTEDGTVGVYNVATVEGARRRGYGAALTRRAVDDGRRRGATVAILQSSVIGQSVYEAIGFRETVRFRSFGGGPSPVAAA